MNKKKLFSLLNVAFTLTLLTSCNKNKTRIALARNIETFLFDKANFYCKPNIEEITEYLEINASFAVYFTNSGCSDCQIFSPILDQYILDNNLLIYKYEYSENYLELIELADKYGSIFFNNLKIDSFLTLPSLAIVNNGNVTYIKRDSFMKTKNAFYNYMNSHYFIGNICYTNGDVFLQNFVNKEFAYLYFEYSNQNNLNIYKDLLEQPCKDSKRNVVISNFNENDVIHLKLCGKNNKAEVYSRNEYIISDKTSENTIKYIL